MCDDGSVERSVEGLAFCHLCESLCKVFARAVYPCRHFDECRHFLIELVCRKTEAVDSLDEDIDALVAPLIASACGDNHSVVRYCVAGKGACYVEQTTACCRALTVELLALRHKVVLEAIGKYHVNGLVQQFGTLAGCDVTNGGETVDVSSCLLLDGLLALHVELVSHLVAVICLEIVVERLVVAGDATTDACCVSGEDGCHLRQAVVYVEHTQSGHPFVAVVYDLGSRLMLGYDVVIETLNDTCGGISEHGSLVVIAIGVKAVHMELVPKLSVYGVFLRIKDIEVHQYSYGTAWYSPATYLDVNAFFCSLYLPFRKQRLVLLEVRTCFFTPTVRTNEDKTVSKLLLESLGSCRQNGVDTAYLIAYFPT